MKIRHLTPLDLCTRLANAWTYDHAELCAEAFDRLCEKWKATNPKKVSKPTCFRGSFDLKHVRLFGAMDVGFLAVGANAALANDFSDLRVATPHRITLVVVESESIRELIRTLEISSRFVILIPKDIEKLLTQPRPLEELKKRLREQIPIRRLLPFDITHPVSPNMFFGRRELLDRFHEEDRTNFAIAGPGRIGKSSILGQYRYELRARSDERRVR